MRYWFGAMVIGLGACAQASSPPGPAPDRLPPRVIQTIPEQNAVVPDFKGPVRIRFDETLSEKGPRPADLVVVSPEAGEVELSKHGRELRVELKRGFQAGRIYHVTVMSGLQDRFGNARPAPYELVFSTGPAIVPTALGGIVTDRLTGKAVTNARVVAVNSTDSAAYTTLTDTAGFYALRSLPIGAYRVTAFLDQNRDRKLNGIEPRDSRIATISSARDTQEISFNVLALDTTPARLLRAEARDSTQVRVTFDDFMEGNEPVAAVRSIVWQLPDSTPVAGALFHVREYEVRQRALGDTAARPQVLRGPAPDSARILPVQELVWVPLRPLTPRTRYRITIQGIRNISGLQNGGGSVTFETPARPRSIIPPKDSTALKPKKPDSTAVRH